MYTVEINSATPNYGIPSGRYINGGVPTGVIADYNFISRSLRWQSADKNYWDWIALNKFGLQAIYREDKNLYFVDNHILYPGNAIESLACFSQQWDECRFCRMHLRWVDDAPDNTLTVKLRMKSQLIIDPTFINPSYFSD